MLKIHDVTKKKVATVYYYGIMLVSVALIIAVVVPAPKSVSSIPLYDTFIQEVQIVHQQHGRRIFINGIRQTTGQVIARAGDHLQVFATAKSFRFLRLQKALLIGSAIGLILYVVVYQETRPTQQDIGSGSLPIKN